MRVGGEEGGEIVEVWVVAAEEEDVFARSGRGVGKDGGGGGGEERWSMRVDRLQRKERVRKSRQHLGRK